MRMSLESLTADAEETGFQVAMLEKSYRLLGLLDAFDSHPFLRGKLALKGGTALNLFIFDVPRLSVDIDLNYVGATDRQSMLDERSRLERAINAVFEREGYGMRRSPQEHAGGKWNLRYASASGQGGRIDVDINYMYRVPLWPVTRIDSRQLGSWRVRDIPVVDIHELAAGKLSALLARRSARDLFDSRLVLSAEGLDIKRLRTAFVVYGAMNRRDWREVSLSDIKFNAQELQRQLLHALRADSAREVDPIEYGEKLVRDCQEAVQILLPFTEAERIFLDLLLDDGIIESELLTPDVSLQERIQAQPMLRWKAQNVKKYKQMG